MRNRMFTHQFHTILFFLCISSALIHCFGSIKPQEPVNTFNITTIKCIEREKKSLLVFKESLVDSYGRLSSWESEEDCCKWSGVLCSNRNHHVIMLDLSASSLRGNISNTSLLDLHHLRYLDLSYNYFNSTPLPNFIGLFPKLTYLDLSHSSFGGFIPYHLGNLSKLQHLDISFNSFRVNGLENMEWLSRLSSLTYLSLSGNQLNGSVPNSISFATLCNLKCLDLSINTLSGNLTSLLKDLACAEASLQSLILTRNTLAGPLIGNDITRFSSLENLSLGGNRLSGFLPRELGQLSHLQNLDLSLTSLRGAISETHFLNLSQLKYLDLSGNAFALLLSPEWVPPFQLNTIRLASCILGPPFPKWLQTQTKFSHLNLSNTGISDTIPTWFWNQSTSLELLDLSSNKIRGRLPDLSSHFVGNPLIDLSSNYFVGPVPPPPTNVSILNLSGNKFSGRLTFLCVTNSTLIFLDLSDNLFSGGIPGCFEYFQDLIVLNLGFNKLSGKIPNYYSSLLSRLEILKLNNNSFFGELPALTFRNSEFLNFIDLSKNKLSGNIPAWIGENLPRLSFLSLRSNKFSGTIPLQLCHLKKLQFLDLSQNSLSGSIPRCVNNFTAMLEQAVERPVYSLVHRVASSHVEYYIYTYKLTLSWKGIMCEFSSSRTLWLLVSLDLSSNKLTGALPEEITNLGWLFSLNVSSNQLHGVIPSKMGNLKNLEVLDLSRNNISGEIPSSFTRLVFLSYLNVSYNNLSGRIPSGTQLQSFDASTYSGNIRLCGIPLRTECPINGSGALSMGVAIINSAPAGCLQLIYFIIYMYFSYL